MFTSTYRITRFAFQNFWRNFWLSLITISMLVLTLVTINILLVLNVLTDRAVDFVEERIEVSVYFNQGVEDDRAVSTAEYLRGLSQVRDVEVVTAEEVLERFKTRHESDEEILASLQEVEGNPFGPTLVVAARGVEDFDFILDALDNPQFAEDIREKDFSDYEQIIDRIEGATQNVRSFVIGLAIIFLFITMLIVFNTVRMGIIIHREEIGVMKLVGASNWFVRAPFILEIILYSFIATLIVAAIILPIVAVLEPYFISYFGAGGGLVQFFEQYGWQIFGGEFLILSFVSIIATGFAMRRYLRV